jgi:hypothetical protein
MNEEYLRWLNDKLLAAMVPAGRHVLGLGCDDGRLREAFKRLHPDTEWTSIDRTAAILGEGYDTVVIVDLLEKSADPARLLREVFAATVPGSRLVCSVSNVSHVSVLERLLAGDLSYDTEGPLDATHVRLLSPASTMKLLLDSRWLPNVRDICNIVHPRPEFANALVAAAAQIGIPPKTAERNILCYHMIIDCIKAPPVPLGAPAPFSVIVPVNNPAQLELNVTRSPGLREVDAPVIEVEGATSAADAFAQGARRAATPWVVFAHQDVYFPMGAGRALAAELGSVPVAQANEELIGFAGVRSGPAGNAEQAGLVIDRLTRFDYPSVGKALSIDEFAVAMTPGTVHRIDSTLGWHLWATDLCIAAARRPEGREARIVRIPLFHNSYYDDMLPPAFHRSTEILFAKYSHLKAIPTLCGVLKARPQT